MKFSLYGSPIHASSFCEVSFIHKLQVVPPSRSVKQGWGAKISHFLALSVNISKTLGDTANVTMSD